MSNHYKEPWIESLHNANAYEESANIIKDDNVNIVAIFWLVIEL